jgi:hypothetical protein
LLARCKQAALPNKVPGGCGILNLET